MNNDKNIELDFSIYHWNENDIQKDEVFVIDTPPPTVSGTLHMGHVYSYCQGDFIARYHRMRGKNVFYPIGFDDNGLPTERLVEKIKSDELKTKITGIKMAENGKILEFIEMCREVIEKAELEFEKLFKSLGISYDWKQKYQTISKETIEIVENSFKELKDKGLIEEKFGPVYWDLVDQTALAQSTIEDKEIEGEEFEVEFKIVNKHEYGKWKEEIIKTQRKFPADNPNKFEEQWTEQEKQIDFIDKTKVFIGKTIKIMTTRPELINNCLAILIHPDDERYKSFHRDKNNILHPEYVVEIAYFNKTVPIIFDDTVKMDKGTGAVMCCAYGDWQDVEWIRKHNLKPEDPNSGFGRTYFSLEEKELQRQSIINGLVKFGALDPNKIRKIKHIVKVGERSKSPIEIIDSKQWYLKTLDFKEDLLEIIKYIDFHPAHMKHKLEQWIQGLNQDWCISRDRFFGIHIPENNSIGRQVFDTWFTSCSTPRIGTKQNEPLYPNTLRLQSHEIIRTWTFGTILKSYLHGLAAEELKNRAEFLKSGGSIQDWFKKMNFTTEIIEKRFIPWKNVMLSGWCLAKDGTKMSKSKGNVITPVELIEEKGADIIRYWSASIGLGVDTVYNETKFHDGKKLITKLQNATKFVVLQSREMMNLPFEMSKITEISDKWILSKLFRLIITAEGYFDKFEYSKVKDSVESFFWNDFCDNYIEICKYRTYLEENCQEKRSAILTLNFCIRQILILFAPFLPYTTENIYRNILLENYSIHKRGNWCQKQKLSFDEELYGLGEKMIEKIFEIRKKKSELKISMNSPLRYDLSNCDERIVKDIEKTMNIIDS